MEKGCGVLIKIIDFVYMNIYVIFFCQDLAMFGIHFSEILNDKKIPLHYYPLLIQNGSTTFHSPWLHFDLICNISPFNFIRNFYTSCYTLRNIMCYLFYNMVEFIIFQIFHLNSWFIIIDREQDHLLHTNIHVYDTLKWRDCQTSSCCYISGTSNLGQ